MRNIVILAAGMGTRLGRPHPKPLTSLADGRSILRHQLDNLRHAFGPSAYVSIVVGFKKELIMEEAAGDAAFVYNELYDQTNTGKSLLKALELAPPGGVLWFNGDVVFSPDLLGALGPLLTAEQSFVAVNSASVAEEEIKYTLDGEGYIQELSKQVVDGLGEAVGINYVAVHDRRALVEYLNAVEETAYFERGMEMAIAENRLRFRPLDISAYGCMEIDCAEDLERANAFVSAVALPRTPKGSAR